jgi:hypothetical protein
MLCLDITNFSIDIKVLFNVLETKYIRYFKKNLRESFDQHIWMISTILREGQKYCMT